MRDVLYLTVRTDHPAWASVTDEKTGRNRKAHWHEHADEQGAILKAVDRLLKGEENTDRG